MCDMHKHTKQSVHMHSIQTCPVLKVDEVGLHDELECEVKSISHTTGGSV